MNTIRANISASISSNALRMHNLQSMSAMNQLSTGKNETGNNFKPSDYIQAGTATSAVRSLAMAAQNINQAIALVNSIDNTASLIHKQLIDMKEKTMTVTGTISPSYARDAGIICDYIQWTQENIIELAAGHSFNGINFMIGGGENDQTTTALTFNLNSTGGATSADSFQMTFKSFHPRSATAMGTPIYGDPDNPDMPLLNATAGTDTHAYGDSAMYSSLRGREGGWHTDTMDAASHSIIQMDRAISGVATERTRLAGYLSRLTLMSETSLGSVLETKKHRSLIEDADYAKNIAQLSKKQILKQTATAILTQANKNKGSLLELLQ